MTHDFTFYSWPVSLYSGKARSYLIKQGADFQDVSPIHESYEKVIRPAIGRWIIPVMQTADGEIVQDGVDIIDWYEQNRPLRYPAYPATPRHLLVSHIMEIFGGEGLLRPAMHYRWNFDETNLDFIIHQFGSSALPYGSAEERHALAEHAAGRMRNACTAFGVNEQTIPQVEASYIETLHELQAHFSQHPYLLGGVPSLGDYGLVASLFAHLGRDPYPSALMKSIAPSVYRWTERMNKPNADFSELVGYEEALIADDAIPDSLLTLLKRVAADYLPEIKAMIAFSNDWLADNKPAQGDNVGGISLGRGIGMCSFDWRGVTVKAVVMPYRIFMLQRIQDAYDGLADEARASVDALLAATGLSDIITTRCTRRVERANHLEIWAGDNPAD